MRHWKASYSVYSTLSSVFLYIWLTNFSHGAAAQGTEVRKALNISERTEKARLIPVAEYSCFLRESLSPGSARFSFDHSGWTPHRSFPVSVLKIRTLPIIWIQYGRVRFSHVKIQRRLQPIFWMLSHEDLTTQPAALTRFLRLCHFSIG